ncbi:MAG TPA: Dabb family protein [Acidimicrobiales bacterium]|nr:Dabb family protein [Acidimicrobiales bacterium]
MIRNVVMVKLRPDHDPALLARLQDGFRSLNCPGTVAYTVGSDAGLKDGNWSFAIVADFEDEQSYRGYDADAEHNRLRAELAPMVESIARVQFRL